MVGVFSPLCGVRQRKIRDSGVTIPGNGVLEGSLDGSALPVNLPGTMTLGNIYQKEEKKLRLFCTYGIVFDANIVESRKLWRVLEIRIYEGEIFPCWISVGKFEGRCHSLYFVQHVSRCAF